MRKKLQFFSHGDVLLCKPELVKRGILDESNPICDGIVDFYHNDRYPEKTQIVGVSHRRTDTIIQKVPREDIFDLANSVAAILYYCLYGKTIKTDNIYTWEDIHFNQPVFSNEILLIKCTQPVIEGDLFRCDAKVNTYDPIKDRTSPLRALTIKELAGITF